MSFTFGAPLNAIAPGIGCACPLKVLNFGQTPGAYPLTLLQVEITYVFTDVKKSTL